ncbi:MAG: S9 family peptidase [Armatimonadetes bacterium]|nr:S9 family peptidase [Armatimonadota bacterium]
MLCPLLPIAIMATLQFKDAEPPVARKTAHKTTLHGETVIDNYHWLRNKKSKAVIDYLEAENAYTDSVMKGSQPLEDELYDEMLGRIKQTDLSVPYPYRGYTYYTRTQESKQYPIQCRKKIGQSTEEVLLDVNELAKGQKFMSVGAFAISPNGKMLAYTTDNTGFRQYRLHVKDLETGKLLPDTAERVDDAGWAEDGRTIFYITEDPVTKRSDTIWRKKLGGKAESFYHEKDALYNVGLDTSLDHKYIFFGSGSTDNNELWFIPADQPNAKRKLIEKRQGKLKYSVEHRNGTFYIHTNKDAKDYRVMTATPTAPGQKNWKPLIPAIPSGRITGVSVFNDFMMIGKRENGLPGIEIYDFKTKKRKAIPPDEKVYSMGGNVNREFDTKVFRYSYSSPLTPSSVYEIDVNTMKRKLLKRVEVLGGFNPKLYVTERVWASAPDGARIPIGLVSKKTDEEGPRPLLLGGYGSYGASASFGFSSNDISLLDRGFVIATAQIRGGSDMGEAWYESGKLMHKRNTFSDFAACADHLVYEGYTTRNKLAIVGGSAGGLLIGATLNMRPDLCRAAVLHVPFVDVINTMLDETLPLTVGEFLEWGNPKKKDEYLYMRSYSPYENIRSTSYPMILVKTSLNDSQVMYWEPAKYVARMREVAYPEMLLFKVNMAAGHGGSSGRYDRLREVAFDHAFLLTALK